MDQYSQTYFTDANGFDLIERSVMRTNVDYFTKELYPVDASITMQNYAKTQAFTVWNDRPQAGSVHDDNSIKLLIDRRTKQYDNAGMQESMYGPEDVNGGKLHLYFRLKV